MKIIERYENSGDFYIFCPGCYEQGKHWWPDDESRRNNNAIHRISLTIHSFNGNFDAPTLTPSLLEHRGPTVCHSFVTDGRIQYLHDCTHLLIGQTVELMEIPQYFIDIITTQNKRIHHE